MNKLQKQGKRKNKKIEVIDLVILLKDGLKEVKREMSKIL